MKPFEYYEQKEMEARHQAELKQKERAQVRHKKQFNYEKASILGISIGIVFTIFLFGASISILAFAKPIIHNSFYIVKATIEVDEKEDFENEKIEEALLSKANKIENCKITFYCIEKYPHICNAGEPYKAADGSDPIPYVTCAAPPEIPLGSTVIVDWGDGIMDYYVATDRGGSIKDNRIDLCVKEHQEALNFGVKYADIYWIGENGNN